jgi:Fe-S-cluster-containing dehydrogenase component
VDTANVREGAKAAFGAPLTITYKFEKAERILALDSDFLGMDADHVAYSAAFAAKRTVEKKTDAMNRLYVVESTHSVTGTAADHRLRLASSQIGGFLVAVAKELVAAHKGALKKPAAIPALLPAETIDEKWPKAVAKDLAANAGKSIVVVGARQPAWVHALAHAVNDALGNYDAGVAEFRDPPFETTEDKPLSELVAAMKGGKVSTLLVVGGNPVFNAPADFAFKTELAKVAKKIRLGLFFDHTSEACDWHLPLSHYLEGWGDAEASDGTLCCVQPLIAPLNSAKPSDATELSPPPRGGRTVLEVLALLTQFAFDGGDAKTNPPTTSFFIAQAKAYELVRRAFAARSGVAIGSKEFDTEFNRYKQLGFLPADKDKAARKPKPVSVDGAKVAAGLSARRPNLPTKDALEVGFFPDYKVFDGRFAMNTWMQEFPDPITKLVWDNAALVSPKTAELFKLKQSDIVKLTVNGATVEVPVFPLPGLPEFTLVLPFGQYGEQRIHRVPDGGGFDVFPLRKSDGLHFAVGCKLEVTGKRGDLVTTQEHGVIPEGREIVSEVTLADYQKKLAHHAHDHDSHPSAHGPTIGFAPDKLPHAHDLKKELQGGYGNPQQKQAPAEDKQKRFPLSLAKPELLDSQFQWGMTIDLNTCTGCGACMIACQSENNIPVVGKHEVKRNREMHWIRLDRYFTSDIENPTVVHQPVACQHCEAAPCEQVCPVNAAVHSPEGLNLQVYNRCIGTRYCANTCPYKVRRFNWFDFNKRRQDELRVATPFASGGASVSDTGIPETLKMQKNPDVTVRMRGVMEKCTYCVQRIERGKTGAKIAATEVAQGRRVIETDGGFKPEGDPSAYRKPKNAKAAGYDLDKLGRVTVPDGLIVTACEAACPSGAIVFGNALDPNSRVSKLKQKEGEYMLLGELNVKPRTSYLPRLRNLNPELV